MTTTLVLCVLVSIPVGWFAGVLVDRVPDRLPLFRPWPGIRLDAWHLLTHLGVTATFLAAGWRFADAPLAELLGALLLFAVIVPLSVIDIQVQRLPDRIVAPAYVVMLSLVVVASLEMREPERIRYAVLGALVWVICLGIGWLIGMGFGDVKAGGVMGLYLGWLAPSSPEVVTLVLYALIIGVAIASVYGIADRIVYAIRVPRQERRQRGKRWFALGPFLALGAVVVVMVHPALLTSVV